MQKILKYLLKTVYNPEQTSADDVGTVYNTTESIHAFENGVDADDGTVSNDSNKLVVGMEIETDLDEGEIRAGVENATESKDALETENCSCQDPNCNALACAFCDSLSENPAEGCEEAFIVSDVALEYDGRLLED